MAFCIRVGRFVMLRERPFLPYTTGESGLGNGRVTRTGFSFFSRRVKRALADILRLWQSGAVFGNCDGLAPRFLATLTNVLYCARDDGRSEYRKAMMAQLLIPTSDRTAAAERLQVNVHVQAEVLSAEIARRKANVWLLMNVGNLLGAENPELVLSDKLTWRVDVVLTSPTRGRVGRIGQLYIDAMTGEALPTETLIDDLLANADALAAN